MDHRSLVASCLLGLACLAGLPGCRTTPTRPAEPTRSETTDPTSWSEPTISRGGDAAAGRGLTKSSRLSGALSDEGADIERSLGVGR